MQRSFLFGNELKLQNAHNHMEERNHSYSLISSLNKQRNRKQKYEVTNKNPKTADKGRTET